jgi:hypothetical protein
MGLKHRKFQAIAGITSNHKIITARGYGGEQLSDRYALQEPGFRGGKSLPTAANGACSQPSPRRVTFAQMRHSGIWKYQWICQVANSWWLGLPPDVRKISSFKRRTFVIGDSSLDWRFHPSLPFSGVCLSLDSLLSPDSRFRERGWLAETRRQVKPNHGYVLLPYLPTPNTHYSRVRDLSWGHFISKSRMLCLSQSSRHTILRSQIK